MGLEINFPNYQIISYESSLEILIKIYFVVSVKPALKTILSFLL